jgi:hypothetical protein
VFYISDTDPLKEVSFCPFSQCVHEPLVSLPQVSKCLGKTRGSNTQAMPQSLWWIFTHQTHSFYSLWAFIWLMLTPINCATPVAPPQPCIAATGRDSHYSATVLVIQPHLSVSSERSPRPSGQAVPSSCLSGHTVACVKAALQLVLCSLHGKTWLTFGCLIVSCLSTLFCLWQRI